MTALHLHAVSYTLYRPHFVRLQHWLPEVLGDCDAEFTYLNSTPARVWHVQVMLTDVACSLALVQLSVANHTAAARRCKTCKEAKPPADTGNVSTNLPI